MKWKGVRRHERGRSERRVRRVVEHMEERRGYEIGRNEGQWKIERAESCVSYSFVTRVGFTCQQCFMGHLDARAINGANAC